MVLCYFIDAMLTDCQEMVSGEQVDSLWVYEGGWRQFMVVACDLTLRYI